MGRSWDALRRREGKQNAGSGFSVGEGEEGGAGEGGAGEDSEVQDFDPNTDFIKKETACGVRTGQRKCLERAPPNNRTTISEST